MVTKYSKDEILKKGMAVVNVAPVLINAVSRRLRELLRGDKPFVQAAHLKDMSDIAVEEIVQGKVKVKVNQKKKES